ncbi:membrane protein implicated in regulation of membrane protease activity [Haloactinopolyspora alba]|uniref:Membrane protein implicated in regulation of membrane protease activity n=1 Tax=Haloactinopolyspora alba TaxID=648780 RepID=A0A2P8DFW2_9ACTN|nr:NfeD family protein [Haloactinopolyspora alba]PSK96100.1 membrane protein implicated in regulation of membrane protease activity [Haloactinopolyspora alba]
MSSLWEWLANHAWVLGWAGLALVLGTVELTTLDFFFLMLALGAASGSVAAGAGAEFVVQLLVAVGVSVALLGVVRPAAKRRFLTPAPANVGVDALIGKMGVVVEQVHADGGLVKLSGEIWTARPYDGSSVYDTGTRVDVVEIRGATALVLGAAS